MIQCSTTRSQYDISIVCVLGHTLHPKDCCCIRHLEDLLGKRFPCVDRTFHPACGSWDPKVHGEDLNRQSFGTRIANNIANSGTLCMLSQ